MSALGQRLRDSGLGRWFYGRERNERRIIAALGLLIAAALFWLLAWQPISNWHDVATNRYSNAQTTLDYVKANGAAARGLTQQRTSDTPVMSVVTRAAQAHNLTLNRVQPEASGALSVVLQAQAFDQVFLWIAQLEQNNGITVQRVSVSQDDAPGIVNAQVRFR